MTQAFPDLGMEGIEFDYEVDFGDRLKRQVSVDDLRATQRLPETFGLQEGDTVALVDPDEKGNKRKGTVRYVGKLHCAKGYWIGVELYAGVGRHNGTVDGVTYFKAKKK